MNENLIVSDPKPRDPRALNAYRHGLTGQVLILPPDDQAAYLLHCQGIQESLAPEGAMETGLVQSVADDRWRLTRAAAIENSIFAIGIGAARPPNTPTNTSRSITPSPKLLLGSKKARTSDSSPSTKAASSAASKRT